MYEIIDDKKRAGDQKYEGDSGLFQHHFESNWSERDKEDTQRVEDRPPQKDGMCISEKWRDAAWLEDHLKWQQSEETKVRNKS